MYRLGLTHLSDTRSCANLDKTDTIMNCDIEGDNIVLKLFNRGGYLLSGEIRIRKTDELLALRRSVFTGGANPALLADMLEENRDYWTYYNIGSNIIEELRGCWSESEQTT